MPVEVLGRAIDAFLFDLDGVVTRTARVHARAWKRLFDEFLASLEGDPERLAPFRLPEDYLAWVDGKPRYEGVRSFLQSRAIELPGGNGPFLPFGIYGVLASMPFAVWLFLAIEQLPLAAEESVDPKRDMPKGIMLGMFTLIALGFLVLLFNPSIPIERTVTDAAGTTTTVHGAFALGTSGEQARAKLTEDGGIEPRVGQFEPERVFPVDPGADGVGGWSVGEVLSELEDGDQCQPPGRGRGLPLERIEVGEVGVVEDGAEFVAEPEVGTSGGESGAGDAGGILGDGRDESELKRHGAASSRATAV